MTQRGGIKKLPGDSLIGIGGALAVISLVLVVIAAGTTGAIAGFPVMLIFAGLLMVAIGYMKRAASSRR